MLASVRRAAAMRMQQCRSIKPLQQRCASITALDERRLAALPVEKTVTFSIVAHVDHGKSSLAQRLLEKYGNIARTEGASQSALDTLDVERERGITVKAVTASMLVGEYLVNLVDTPGHADFAHEVRRSLGACDGALLLVDASQGIEAQTLKVAAAARAASVPLVCAASKIDLPTADAVEVALELAALEFADDPEDVLCVSAKSGDGVDAVLPAIIDAFRQPADADDRRTKPTRCRVLDGRYDVTRGVVAVIQCVDGALREGDRIAFLGGDGKTDHTVQELGLLTPAHHRTGFLNAGCVGYLVAGLRDVRQARVGDTLCLATERDRLEPVDPLPPATQPGLFASVFPPDGGMFDEMSRAVDRLALNDASVTVRHELCRNQAVRRVDGVEDDATVQHERAVNFDFHTGTACGRRRRRPMTGPGTTSPRPRFTRPSRGRRCSARSARRRCAGCVEIEFTARSS